eukprot:scaffold14515_cov97-Cylindrotheca_fusiformis.AAC.3
MNHPSFGMLLLSCDLFNAVFKLKALNEYVVRTYKRPLQARAFGPLNGGETECGTPNKQCTDTGCQGAISKAEPLQNTPDDGQVGRVNHDPSLGCICPRQSSFHLFSGLVNPTVNY